MEQLSQSARDLRPAAKGTALFQEVHLLRRQVFALLLGATSQDAFGPMLSESDGGHHGLRRVGGTDAPSAESQELSRAPQRQGWCKRQSHGLDYRSHPWKSSPAQELGGCRRT